MILHRVSWLRQREKERVCLEMVEHYAGFVASTRFKPVVGIMTPSSSLVWPLTGCSSIH